MAGTSHHLEAASHGNRVLLVALVCSTVLASACTVFRFRLEPPPSDTAFAQAGLRGTFEFEFESEYSSAGNEPSFREHLEAVLAESGEFHPTQVRSGPYHLHVRVSRRFHGATPQEWLTGLTLGLIPSTAERDTYVFEYTSYRDGVPADGARYALWSRAYSWIFLVPWGELGESPTHYGRGAQLDHFERSLRAFLAGAHSNAAAGAPAAAANGCAFEASGKAHLSSPVREDTVTASVRGRSCLEATFALEVRSPDGALTYRHSQPFVDLRDEGAAPPRAADLAAAAAFVVRRAASDRPLSRASSLPAYRPGAFEFEMDMASVAGKVLVSEEVYDRIRNADQPIISHVIGSEMGRYVAIDPDTGDTVPILDVWL